VLFDGDPDPDLYTSRYPSYRLHGYKLRRDWAGENEQKFKNIRLREILYFGADLHERIADSPGRIPYLVQIGDV
jgi:hypothetical protein